MNTAKLQHQRKAKSENLIIESSHSLLTFFGKRFVGFSDRQHNFNLSLLDSRIRKDQFAHVGESVSTSFISVNLFSAIYSMLFSSVFSASTSENGAKPIDQSSFSIANLKASKVMDSSSLFIARVIANMKAAFSIDYTGKISYLSNRILLSFISTFGHVKSVVNSAVTIYERLLNVQPQRLTPRTPQGEVIV